MVLKLMHTSGMQVRKFVAKLCEVTGFPLTCDINIVEQGSSVQREIKNNQNVEPESSGQQVQLEIKERAED